jgi:hypothetical protein
MARSTGQGGPQSLMKAAARLEEINREVAEILRVFPDLRTFQRGRARGWARVGEPAASDPRTKRGSAFQRCPVLH